MTLDLLLLRPFPSVAIIHDTCGSNRSHLGRLAGFNLKWQVTGVRDGVTSERWWFVPVTRVGAHIRHHGFIALNNGLLNFLGELSSRFAIVSIYPTIRVLLTAEFIVAKVGTSTSFAASLA